MKQFIVGLIVGIVLVGALGFSTSQRLASRSSQTTNFGIVTTNTSTAVPYVSTGPLVVCRLDSSQADSVRVGTLASAPTSGAGYKLEPGETVEVYYPQSPLSFIADANTPVVHCYSQNT